MNIESTENELITAVTQLSTIADTNSHYTHCLAKQVEETGKTIGELTIAEFLNLNTQCKAFFNSPLPKDTSRAFTKYKAKQVMASLEYISMSIKTVQNDIQDLSDLDQEVVALNEVKL